MNSLKCEDYAIFSFLKNKIVAEEGINRMSDVTAVTEARAKSKASI